MVAFWFSSAFVFLLGRTLCGCQRPFASLSLGIVGKAGSLPSIPGTFGGIWVWVCLGIGGWYTGCIVCLFTSEHCAECAFFGARMVSCFWESASSHILGNRKWFHGSVGFRLVLSNFFLLRRVLQLHAYLNTSICFQLVVCRHVVLFYLCIVIQDSAITPAHSLKLLKDENAIASSRKNSLLSHRPFLERGAIYRFSLVRKDRHLMSYNSSYRSSYSRV